MRSNHIAATSTGLSDHVTARLGVNMTTYPVYWYVTGTTTSSQLINVITIGTTVPPQLPSSQTAGSGNHHVLIALVRCYFVKGTRAENIDGLSNELQSNSLFMDIPYLQAFFFLSSLVIFRILNGYAGQ